ncbi:putative mediator of RNA polymerase II transcription subunit 29 isoform X2 [Clytia hemisphaerica]|uniref:Uncharacterized protein n=2 Tax=Clytia hemisphaerica TaxID=252671 RepID=A0A7M5XF46_9CNID
MTCHECGKKQKKVGKTAIDYKPVGKICLTTERYKIHGRLMGLEEQHHQNGLVVYLSKNGNGHSIDHNEEGAFFSWFLKEDNEGKKFLPYLKDRFVEWSKSQQTVTNNGTANNEIEITSNETAINEIEITSNETAINETANNEIEITSNETAINGTANSGIEITSNETAINETTNNEIEITSNETTINETANNEIKIISNETAINETANNEIEITSNETAINETANNEIEIISNETAINETANNEIEITSNETAINGTVNSGIEITNNETPINETANNEIESETDKKRKKQPENNKKNYPKRKKKKNQAGLEKVDEDVELVIAAPVCDRKSLAGKCVGLYTENPYEYWVFGVEKVSTKCVHGKFFECFDRENRLYRHYSDGQHQFYASIVRRGVEQNDFFFFQLEKSKEGHQVPLIDHLALMARLEQCAQSSR